MKRNYYKTEAPTGETIRYAIRRKRYLVIFTSFDPYRFIDFAESYIQKISEVERMEVINIYDDETGYYIFKIKNDFDKKILFNEILNEFENYFTTKTYHYD